MDRNRQIIEAEIQKRMVEENTSRDKISTLNLSNNQIVDLPLGVFDGLTGLKVLNLNDNQIVNLPEDIFSDLSHVQIFLSHNPLQTIHITTKYFLEQNNNVQCYVQHTDNNMARLCQGIRKIGNFLKVFGSDLDLESLEVVDYDDINCKGALN